MRWLMILAVSKHAKMPSRSLENKFLPGSIMHRSWCSIDPNRQDWCVFEELKLGGNDEKSSCVCVMMCDMFDFKNCFLRKNRFVANVFEISQLMFMSFLWQWNIYPDFVTFVTFDTVKLRNNTNKKKHFWWVRCKRANMCLIGCRHRKSQNTFLVILSTESTKSHTKKNLKTGGGIDNVKNLNI